jgi:hypothetical protein
MNQWAFVAAAYAVMLGGTGLVLAISYAAMKRAEK